LYYNFAKQKMSAQRPLSLLLAFTLLLPVASAVPGVAYSDLAGAWRLNIAKSKTPKGGSGGSRTIYIDCMGSTIRMNVTADTTDQWQEFVTDGDEHVVARTGGAPLLSDGHLLIHVAYWKKSSLITKTIIRESTDAGAEITLSKFVERWTLSKDGLRLSRERGDPAQLLIYDKAP
jgi:hypothetical protein